MDLKLVLIVDFYQFIHFLPLQLVSTNFGNENGALILVLSPKFKIYASECGPIWANPKNWTFFLGTVSQLIWHIYGLFDTRYQMSVCDSGKGEA